ncbi:hypothetical protein ACTA71_007368 [Dictyostelium dimigraforme]
MDTLFFKVYRNVYIRNIIFEKIRESIHNLYLVGFSYYEFPLISIIKTRNEQLLKERLYHYKNYILIKNDSFTNTNNINNNIKNDNNNYEKSNKDSKNNNFKYYFNLDSNCINELFKWRGVDIEIVKQVLFIYEEENRENNRLYLEVGSFYKLIENGNFKILEYIFTENKRKGNNILITPREYISNLSFSRETIDQTFEFLNTFFKIDGLLFNMNYNLISILIDISNNGTTHLYGDLILNQLEFYNENSTKKEISRLVQRAMINGDILMIKLLILKISKEFNINYDEDSRFLFKDDKDLKFQINSKILDLLSINIKILYECNIFEMFKEIISSNLIETSINGYIRFDIINPCIANFILSNQLISQLISHRFIFSLNSLPDDEYKKANDSLFTGKNIEFMVTPNCLITINKLKFIKNQIISFEDSLSMIFKIILKSKDLECFQLLMNIINANYQTFELPSLGIMSSNCLPIIEYAFNGSFDHFIFNEHIYEEKLCSLLTKSMEIGFNGFDLVKFNKVSSSNTNTTKLYIDLRNSIYYHLNPMNYQFEKLESRINFIEKAKIIIDYLNLKLKDMETNNLYINSLHMVTNDLILKDQINKYYSNGKLMDLITKNINFKLLKLLIQLGFINEKKKFLYEIFKRSGSNRNKLILFLISIDYLKIIDLSILIKLSVKYNNLELVHILLCRNQQCYPKTIPFHNSNQDRQEFIEISLYENYIDSVHSFLLTFGKGHKIIDNLLKDGYLYSPNHSNGLSFKRNKLDHVALECHNKTLKEFLYSIEYKNFNNDEIIDVINQDNKKLDFKF